MAVTLRLSRYGKKAFPFYRIVASEKGSKRDGKFIEIVGTYSPLSTPAAITLKEDKVKHWISCGAQVTETVKNLIGKKLPGYYEEIEKNRLSKLQSARKKRKARQKKSAPKKQK